MEINHGITATNFQAKFVNQNIIKDIDIYAKNLACAKKYSRAREIIERVKKDDEIIIEIFTNSLFQPSVTFNYIKDAKMYEFFTEKITHPYTFAVRSIIKLSKLIQNK